LYHYQIMTCTIPWLPVSVIGTAVAFYVGFKNNSAYERLWEARKIWGGIVNSSRTWGMFVDGFINNLFAEKKYSEGEIKETKKRLIYRHIAWLYALRSQLLVSTSWEHISYGGLMTWSAKRYQKLFGIGLVADEVTKVELSRFLPKSEHNRLVENVNTATQIINEQNRDLTHIREMGLIEDFRHMEMSNVLALFYDYQGKARKN
jgi:putative membrane protein